MKRLILAEKPSVARDIASALCKSLNKDASKKGILNVKKKPIYHLGFRSFGRNRR